MIRMEVRGTEQLKAKFGQIKAEMYKGFAAALLAGAFPVSNAAKEGAPYLTGNLRRSYHIGTKTANITEPQASDGAAQPPRMGAVAAVADKLRKTGKAELLVGTDVVYAAPQEFLYKPHLRPALDNNRAEVDKETKRAIQMVLKKVSR